MVALLALATVAALRMRTADAAVRTVLVPATRPQTGPVPAANTAFSVGPGSWEDTQSWEIARTGSDDTQLVLYAETASTCGLRAEPVVGPGTIAIHTFTVPPDGGTCTLAATPRALAVVVPEPRNGRPVTAPGPVTVVDGAILADLHLPGVDRAAEEHLARGSTPGSFGWSRSWGRPGTEGSITLDQQRGGWAVDGAALLASCPDGAPSVTDAAVHEAPAKVTACPDGRVTAWWMHDGDRMSVTTMGTGADRTLELAGSVVYGR